MSSLLTTLLLRDAVVKDGEWDESKHPRDDHGRFSDGGGTGYSATAQASIARHMGEAPSLPPDTLAARKPGPMTQLYNELAGAGAAKVPDSLPPDSLGPRTPKQWVPDPLAEPRRAPKPPVQEIPSPGPGASTRMPTEAEVRLKTATVTDDSRTDGGVSETHFLTLENGIRAVFKPQDGAYKSQLYFNINPGQDTEREAGAWEVAKLVGMEDLVPTTVIRTVDGRMGSLQEFVSNSIEAGSSQNPYDGSKDFARAAVFDSVIGNQDRHMGNWMVNENTGKIMLIDHGLSFPESMNNRNVDGFMHEVSSKPSNIIGRPELVGTPADYARPYLEHKGEIMTALTNLHLPAESVQSVGRRIDLLGTLNTPQGWDRIHNGDLRYPVFI